MKPSRKKLLGLLALLLFLVSLSATAWKVYRAVQQPELNRALIAAIRRNDTAEVVALLSEGANANAHDVPPDPRPMWRRIWENIRGKPAPIEEGPTALIVLLQMKDDGFTFAPENVPVVKALLNRGADVNVCDEKSFTPLMWAAFSTKHETVRLLLEKKAQINARNDFGQTPLDYAVSNGDAFLVRWLLAKGGKFDSSALLRASLDGQTEIVRMLIPNGGDVNFVDPEGDTPLSYAAKSESVDCVQLLLANGARVHTNAMERYLPFPWRKRNATRIAELIKIAAAQQAKARK